MPAPFTWHEILLNMAIPFLVSIIVRPNWDPKIKYGLTLCLCLAASAGEFYLAVWLVGGSQATFWEAFSKSFLIIFATYASVLKFPIPGQTIAARLEETGPALPATVTAVLDAQTAAAKKEAQVVQVQAAADEAKVAVVEAKQEAIEAKDIKEQSAGAVFLKLLDKK